MNLLFQAAQQARLIRERQELIFWTTCGPATTFDPKITGVDGVWFFDDGTTLDAASGVEISKTFATDGLHRAVYRPTLGGLGSVTKLDCNTDAITSIISINRLRSLTELTIYTTGGMWPILNISDIPKVIKYSGNNGSGSYIPLAGPISALSRSMTDIAAMRDPYILGPLSDFPATMKNVNLSECLGIESSSVASLTAIRTLYVEDCNWLEEDVDAVLLSISDAIHANAAHFTYATPILHIGGSGATANAAPSGQIDIDTVDPATTPGNGNSDTNWEWDAGANKHKAISGMAAIYRMKNNTGHVWTVTYTIPPAEAWHLPWGSPISLADGDYTMVVLPDTQNETTSHLAMWEGIYDYIIANKTTLNIKAVIGVGDVIDSVALYNFTDALTGWNAMRAVGLPILPLIGNHDYDNIRNRIATAWNVAFGPTYFSEDSNYGDCYNSSTENYYIFVTVGAVDYLIIGLEFWPRDAVLTWAGGIVNANPTKKVIVVTHAYMESTGAYRTETVNWGGGMEGNYGQAIWDEFVKLYANIFLVLNGHVDALPSPLRTDNGDNANKVTQLMTDYQDRNFGNGYITFLIFRAGGTIDIIPYSTVTGLFDEYSAYTIT